MLTAVAPVPPAPVSDADRATATPPTRKFGCGFLPPKMVCSCDDLALPGERVEIMRHRHQIGLGRQLVGGVAPIAVGENAELARRRQALHRSCTSAK